MIKCNVRDDTIEITARDTLTDQDYQEILPVIDRVLQTREKPKFLIILEQFKGWEMPAAWIDLKYGFKHMKAFGPMAIVGDNITQKWGTQFSNIFFPSKIRYFDKAEIQKARLWLAAQTEIESLQKTGT